MSIALRKVGSAALTLAIVLSSFAPIVTPVAQAAADGQLSVLINGQPPSGFCIAGEITVSGVGKTGGQGGTWNLAIGWGNNSTTTATSTTGGMITSGTLSGQNKDFTYSYTNTAGSGGLRIVLYHSQESGQDGQVIFVNQCVAPPTQGVVIVKKLVINDNGGSATSSDFTLHINGNNFAGSEIGTQPGFSLNPGAYQITEDAKTGYSQSDFSCTDNNAATTTSNNTINVSAGHNYVCTVTNNDEVPTTGTLIVKKEVTTDNGGSASPANWSLHVKDNSDAEVSGSPAAGSAAGTSYTLAGGTYVVSETGGVSGYNPDFSSCGNEGAVTVTNGQTTTCTVKNNDIAPLLTLVKELVGGLAVKTDWTLSATGPSTISGATGSGSVTSAAVNAGSYALTETGSPTHYLPSAWSCEGDGTLNGNILIIGVGASTTCKITNTFQEPTPGSITIIKETNGGDASFDFTGDLNEFTLSTIGGTANQTFIGLSAGTYNIAETAQDGWNQTSVSCVNNDTEAIVGTSLTGITLAAHVDGENNFTDSVTCTVVNTKTTGTLIVTKVIATDDETPASPSAFSFTVDGGAPIAFENDGTNEVTVSVGDHTVIETSAPGYATSYSNCEDVAVTPGGQTSCTITNDNRNASLSVVKHTIGANGTFGFSITGQEAINLTTVDGWATSTITLSAGNYDVTESSMPQGWTANGVSCLYDGNSVGNSIQNGKSISVDPGDSVVCTFTNTATGADLSVVKTVDDNTPDNGQQITYTLTATNAGPAGTTGALVTDLLPSGLTYVSDNGAGAYATSTGIWTIGTLAAGANATLQIVATVNADAGATVTNIATTSLADENVNDYDSNDNTGSVSVTVNTPTPPPSGGGGGGGGGGGNGPISTIVPNNGGVVLGASTDECTEYLTSYIKYGRANNTAQVVKLQEFLNNFEANNLSVTGTYDQASLAAVHAFQTKYLQDVMIPWGATKSTGYVYYTTKKKINEIYCKFTKQFPLTADQLAEIARIKAAGESYTTAQTAPKIAPKTNVGSGVTLPAITPAAPAPAKDEDATIGGTPTVQSSQTASPATAPAAQGNWWTNFWNWVFGK